VILHDAALLRQKEAIFFRCCALDLVCSTLTRSCLCPVMLDWVEMPHMCMPSFFLGCSDGADVVIDEGVRLFKIHLACDVVKQ